MINRFVAALSLFFVAAPAFAQSAPIPPDVRDRNGKVTTATAIVCVQDPAATPVVLVACGTGSGGGGAGDASAANQTTQITAANLTNTTLGAVTASPTANTIGDRLKTLNTTLGTPFQAGGSIGNTAFGISGTLPAFATAPTFNLGTLNGAATAAKQDTIIAQTKALSQAATSTSTNVTAATASTTLLAANTNRLGGAIVNDSTSILYIKLSSGASSTSYDYYLAGSASGVPAQFEIPANWIGPVYGIWVAANGAARVSERTQ